jgi:hypothetical protein
MTFAPKQSLIVATAIGVSTAMATVATLTPEAHAGEREVAGSAPASADATPPIAWGLRLNGGVGGAADGEAAWRAGLDAEYWLWRNVGIGVQFGYQQWSTFNLCAGDCNSASGELFSIAPSVSLRGSNPANFPIVSVALGWSWEEEQSSSWCDYDPACPGTSSSRASGGGPYGSLTAAWVFHPGDLRPAAGAFAIGPMLRVDGFSLFDGSSSGPVLSTPGWTITTGVTLGFGRARGAPL